MYLHTLANLAFTGDPASPHPLVNDLDLSVTASANTSQTFLGNQGLYQDLDATMWYPDQINNQEQLMLEAQDNEATYQILIRHQGAPLVECTTNLDCVLESQTLACVDSRLDVNGSIAPKQLEDEDTCDPTQICYCGILPSDPQLNQTFALVFSASKSGRCGSRSVFALNQFACRCCDRGRLHLFQLSQI